jgi:hypothetical protein
MSLGVKKWVRRKYEQVALVAVRKVREIALFWARQCRKSTTCGSIAFDAMSAEPGRNVIAASASLLVGSELITKAVSAAEQAALVTREAAAMRLAMEKSTEEAKGKLQLVCVNSETGKLYKDLSQDDYTDLYRSSRLEMRLFFDRTKYSRLLVIAPNPATARGWTGHVIRDEAGFTRKAMEVELRIAVKPIMDTDPSFKMIYASNLPLDDTHPFFEDTLPPPDAQFAPNPKGNFYRGQNGMMIHRVSLSDAYAAGHTLYDTREGKPLTYEQFCLDPSNKLGLDGSYRLIHRFGGAAAIDLFAMLTAQRRGVGQCALFIIDDEADFRKSVKWLMAHLGDGAVGIGIDPATTTGETSNPTSVTVTEMKFHERLARAVFIWKEKNPKVARSRFAEIIQAIGSRPNGGRARRVAIEATSEQYFARETAMDLGHLVPFDQVDVRNKVEPVPGGYERDPNYKTWLSDLYAAQFNDNHYTVPPEDYFKQDHRLMMKVAGVYNADPEPDGKHADTFISGMLADFALTATGGAITPDILSKIHFGGTKTSRPMFIPRRLS